MNKILVSFGFISIFAGIIYLYYITIIPGYLPYQARKMIDRGEFNYIIDVRTPEEWNKGHHPKSILLPIGEFVSELPKRVPDKNSKLLFVCRKGIRSSAAASMARDMGYKNVAYVKGYHYGLS
jgi:rhodanese-related sulfurtransferase